MRLIKPSYSILSGINPDVMLANIEIAGRTCYKSEAKITADSAAGFVRMLIRSGHESVLEHEKITVRFVCDRGVSHELVRHRIASFSQESTRYCNYGKGEVSFIIPEWFNAGDEKAVMSTKDADIKAWRMTMAVCERAYKTLLSLGRQPQQARSVLPNSLKTEIIVSANIREWRLILKQRTGSRAHPQMRELMCPLLDELKQILPALFEDISYYG
jgi:thymidylate synthase (FAD)